MPRMNRAMRFTLFGWHWQAVSLPVAAGILLILTLLLSYGCDNSGSSVPPPPGAKAGRISGKLADARGGPLSNVMIEISGFTTGGESVHKQVEIPGPATEFSIEVPEGQYSAPAAIIKPQYKDRVYAFPLAAVDGAKEWPEARSSKKGLVRDFVWKISGTKPEGMGAALEPSGYWGGAVQFETGADLGDYAQFEITLKPDGPLIDGSQGKDLVFTKKLPWKRAEEHYILDIPFGRYIASVKLVYGTKPRPLKLVCYTIDPEFPDQVPEKTALTAILEYEVKKMKDGTMKLMTPIMVVFP